MNLGTVQGTLGDQHTASLPGTATRSSDFRAAEEKSVGRRFACGGICFALFAAGSDAQTHLWAFRLLDDLTLGTRCRCLHYSNYCVALSKPRARSDHLRT